MNRFEFIKVAERLRKELRPTAKFLGYVGLGEFDPAKGRRGLLKPGKARRLMRARRKKR